MPERTFQQYFLIALLVAVGFAVFFILKPFLAPLALAAVFAVVLQPVYKRALSELRGSRTFAALTTVLIALIAVLVPLLFFGARLLGESEQLYQSIGTGQWRTTLDTGLHNAGPFVDTLIPDGSAKIAEISASVDMYAQEVLSWIIGNLGVAFTGLSSFFLSLFIFFVALYYFLRDGPELCRYFIRLSPLSDEDDAYILSRLALSVNSVVRGKLLIALLQGIFAGIGFAIFGIPNSALWGLIAIVAALIPPFGTAFVTIPAAGYAFLVGEPTSAIGLLIWALFAGLIDNIAGPKLMSSGSNDNPLFILLSVLGGIAFFGPVGVFLGPLTVSLFLTLLSLHIDPEHSRSR